MASTEIIHELDLEEELKNPDRRHFRSIHMECMASWMKIYQPGTILESNCNALYRVKGEVAHIHDVQKDCLECYITSWTKHCPVCTTT